MRVPSSNQKETPKTYPNLSTIFFHIGQRVSDIEGYDESDCQDPIWPLKNNASLFPPLNLNITKFYNSFPNSPNDSRLVLPRYGSAQASDTDNDDEAILAILPTHSRSKHYLYRPWRYITRAAVYLVVLRAYFYLPDESCPWMSRR